jgi:hypothetical protein
MNKNHYLPVFTCETLQTADQDEPLKNFSPVIIVQIFCHTSIFHRFFRKICLSWFIFYFLLGLKLTEDLMKINLDKKPQEGSSNNKKETTTHPHGD